MPTTEQLIAGVSSADKDVRFTAWRGAGDAPADAVAQLAGLAGGGDPGIAKAAREAITTMVHAVGKDPADPRRAPLVQQLLAATEGSVPLAAKIHVLRQLSGIAPEDSTPRVAKLLSNADLREEAVYCLERTPGSAPVKAIAAAYRSAPADFKPRLLAALGHRRADEGVALCLEAMRSTNADLAMAGANALGRIGRKGAAAAKFPDGAWDAQLRYADGLREQGNHADAMRIYKSAMERPESHLQCAGIVGIAKIKTADAAAAIFPKLQSKDRTVRATAMQAWRGLAG
jgi:hypothetical protein